MSSFLSKWLALPASLLLALISGCVTTTVDEVRHGATSLGDGEAVAILGRRHNNAYETETNFVKCIGDSVAGDIPVIPEEQFVDSLFPWFEPRTAPMNTDALPALLAHPPVARKLRQSGVRYLVWVDGSTNTTDKNGAMTCTISPAGPNCFGFLSWERDSNYEATIWDIREQRAVGKISSDATGTSYMPAVVVPIPIIARVQKNACNGLGDQLRVFLAGGEAVTG